MLINSHIYVVLNGTEDESDAKGFAFIRSHLSLFAKKVLARAW